MFPADQPQLPIIPLALAPLLRAVDWILGPLFLQKGLHSHHLVFSCPSLASCVACRLEAARKLPSTRRFQHGEPGSNGIPHPQIHARGQGAQSQRRLLAAGCIVGRIHRSPPVLQVQNTPRPVVGRSCLDRGMGMSLSFLALDSYPPQAATNEPTTRFFSSSPSVRTAR